MNKFLKEKNNQNNLIPKLSNTVHLLGKILGLVIKKQEGTSLFNKVENIRILSKASRGHKNKKEINKAFQKLKNNIVNLNPKESLVIARSFSQFLNFSNLAESLYSVYKIDSTKVRKAQGTNEFIILEDAIANLLKKKYVSKNKFYQFVKQINIELVLTAHPTEVKRRTLIQKFTYVNNILEKFHKMRIFTKKHINNEEKILEKNLLEEITSIWKTDEIKRSRPSPVEEAKWGLAVIEESLWNAIPKVCYRFNEAVKTYSDKSLPINFSPINFGSWMGGDRDGNPNVTAKITEEVILLSRWKAANLYEKELTNLIQSLSMHECSNTLKKFVGNTYEPYRVFLRPIRDKMKNTQQEIELILNKNKKINHSLLVQTINEVIEPLNIVYNSLCSVNCKMIANGVVLKLLRQAHTFGLNLARIDIRQESNRHQKIINNICKKKRLGDYESWSEKKRISFLSKQFLSKKSLMIGKIRLDKEDQEVWSTFKMISKMPRECLGAYIVSMSSSVSDILVVMLLQKEAGIEYYLRVVPLFETLFDLQNSQNVIKNLYNISWYLNQIQHNQEIMIGYSDSSKDAGNFAASWAQYCAQEKLQIVSNQYNVKLTLFHGRGGSVGRGGGPVYAALLSQPPGTVNGRTRVTEQGEIIQQKFSSESLAEYSLGTYVGSVIEATLAPPPKPKKNWSELMNSMSKVAAKSYHLNLNKNPYFLEYYKTVTPQKILGQLFIGSRPTRRKKTQNIKDLRAIPWVFAWTQIRFIIPSWLGTLQALELSALGKNKFILKDMINNWPFFYSMMDMLDMVLTKTDQRVIQFYEECLANEDLKNTGKELRLQLSSLIYLNKKLIPENILNQRKTYRESIKIRNTYAETLNLLQAIIMKKLKASNLNKYNRKILMDALLITVSGLSAAMKNTG